MYQENILTQVLLNQLQTGGIYKLTQTQFKAEYRRELGDNSFRADIFISLSKNTDRVTFHQNNTQFIAIEVKIKDWMQGLYQAWRYNSFAEKSYLAIYKKYANGIDINLFRQYNVGLIVFDEENITVLNKPKNNKFSLNTYSGELREKLWTKLIAVECV